MTWQIGLTVLSDSGSALSQVPHDSCSLVAFVHDSCLDLLGGRNREGHRGRERGQAQGDGDDHGPEELHLLAELGSVLLDNASTQLIPPHSHPKGDSTMIQGGFHANFGKVCSDRTQLHTGLINKQVYSVVQWRPLRNSQP